MSTSEQDFYDQAQAFVDEFLRDMPFYATFLGEHRYDDRLADYSPIAVDDRLRRLRAWLEKFESYSTDDWTVDGRIDCLIMIHTIKRFLRDYEQMRPLQRNPSAVLDECHWSAYLLVVREFAPLPQRMRSLLGRLRQAPRLLAQGQAWIEAAEVPPVWAQVAIESARQGQGLFATLIPALAEQTPDMKDELVAASQATASALQAYADWLEVQVLPQAQGEFAVGKALFDEMLRENHTVSYDAEELLNTGWELFEDTLRQMNALAASMDASKTVEELLEESKRSHPSAEGLLEAYRQEMDRARQFVLDQGIASIPPGESLRVMPTPEFQRQIIPYAAYLAPGFLEEEQDGIFWVTTVEADADAEATERKLRGHPWADLPLTALHEAYPGHHLQLVVDNLLESLPRKFGAYLSEMFVEGWAFYCEELMEQLGYLHLPVQKLARLQAQLWRAARIILDVSLHTGRMTVDEAVEFLVSRAGLEPGDARTEVHRYTMTPTQPQCYLMGKLQFLEIVAEYQRRFPQASMRQMHDEILNCGSLPPRFMRMRLFAE